VTIVERISVATGGAQGNGDSSPGDISSNGRFVVFASFASTLVAGDTNAVSDVFVRDRVSGVTERVSVDSFGVQGYLESGGGSMSADARFVAFSSSATNLVPGDTNGMSDVFVRDRLNGTTELASVSTQGAQGFGSSSWPSISDDGRFLAFSSSALNLAPGAWSASSHVYLRDRQNGTTQLMSAVGPYDCNCPQISNDGNFIAMQSGPNVVISSRQTGAVELVNVSTSGVLSNNFSGLGGISSDGRFVTFNSFATNLVAGDTNDSYDGFVRDRLQGTTNRVTLGTNGIEGNSDSWAGSISADGRFVTFTSYATNVVAGDTNASSDGFVRDLASGTTERVTVSASGAEGDADSWAWFLSSDARFVLSSSAATNLVPADYNASWDAFVFDRAPVLLTYCSAGTTSNGCVATIAASDAPSLSLATPCNIVVTGAEGLKTGMLFYGVDNTSFTPTPWGSGGTSYLCVQQPTQRTGLQSSGGTFNACDGSFVLDWNAYQSAHPFALGNPWSVGDKVFVQAWFRDPPAPKGTNLSNALQMTYVP
jgi:hypothetical protein